MYDEQYDPAWYVDSGCSRHMTGRRECLRNFRSIECRGSVRIGNGGRCFIKGYGAITNGPVTIERVAFVDGLQHNLISVSQLVVGTGNQVTFDDDGSRIIKKETKEVILFSPRDGEMFPLDMVPIEGAPSICLLTKATTDLSWLWHRRLSHMNFRDLNKLVAGDHVRGMPVLKFDNNHLCASCEHGKIHRVGHSSIIMTKVVAPLKLLHIDLYGPSSTKS